jgi:hypothetical protein
MAADPIAAALAWAVHDAGAPPLCLVARLDPDAIDLTLCTAHSGLLSVIDTERARPAAADRRLLHPGARRAIVLERAASSARYRDATVYTDGDGQVRAGELIDAFAPYGAAVADAVSRLRARHPDPAPADVGYVPVGALAAFPLAAVPPGCRRLDPDPATLEVLERGATLLATGAVHFPATYPHAVAVRTREIRGGRLGNVHVVVAPPHTLAAGAEGTPSAAVVVQPDHSPIELDVLVGSAARPVGHPVLDRPANGRYALGLRLVDGIAELVFRGDGGNATRTVGPLPVIGVPS